jgi:PAS domain S-box-containing protein
VDGNLASNAGEERLSKAALQRVIDAVPDAAAIIMSSGEILVLDQQNEGSFERLLNVSPDSVVVMSPSGSILIVNQQTEAMFGYRRDEVLGQPIELLLPERFRERHAEHRAAYVKSPRARPIGAVLDLVGLHRDGHEFPVEVSLSPMTLEHQAVLISTIRDVSSRKRIELELQRKNEELEAQNRRIQEANRMKSEFLANMSHELRTPLNGIIGFSELLYDGKVGAINDEQKEFLGDILTSSRHLHQLINDVLDLAKVESGRMEFIPEEVRMAELVREVSDSLRPIASEKGIQVVAEVDPSVNALVADKHRGASAEVDAWLVKPVEREALLAVLDRAGVSSLPSPNARRETI